MLIKLAEVPEISETGPDGDTIVMKKAVGSRTRDPNYAGADLDSLSVTYIKIWGRLRRMRCDESDRVMFIVDGGGIAQVGGDSPVHFNSGDFIVIPRGTEYEVAGVFTYLVMNSPSYREGSDLRNVHYDGPPTRAGSDSWT